jgi:AmmeMemoRadiSam system protein B
MGSEGMTGIRQPAVAGSFYAGTPEALRRQVEECLPAGSDRAGRQAAVAAVCPHAGLMYSGKTAAAVYARLEPPETLVILGPNHHGVGAEAAIPSHARWETPLGAVEIDGELAAAIRAASRTLEVDDAAHAREHSIEVQMPFLRVLMPGARLVPICLGRLDQAAVADVGRAVAEGVRATGRRAVVVASTDFSHYVPRAVAEARDRHALDAIRALDGEGLLAAGRRERITM